MELSKPSAQIYDSQRRTEVFLVAVDPDDPNDPVFLGFIDRDDPDADEVAGDFLASGTNRLADPPYQVAGMHEELVPWRATFETNPDDDSALSEVDRLEPLAQYDPGSDHRQTLVALVGMIG
ncbi:MAG: hypothetical protein ACPG4T_24160, partial [Nannocystaceae bacterium]